MVPVRWRWKTYGEKRWVEIDCPKCGLGLSIANHTIGPDGVVTPSVVSTHRQVQCGFHDNVRLIDWTA